MLSHVNRIIADVVVVAVDVVVVAKKTLRKKETKQKDELSQYFTDLLFITQTLTTRGENSFYKSLKLYRVYQRLRLNVRKRSVR